MPSIPISATRPSAPRSTAGSCRFAPRSKMATRSRSSSPRPSIRSPAWLSFVVTGKARAKIRRFVKSKEREETVSLGRKIFDEIVQRLPPAARLGSDGRGAEAAPSPRRRRPDGGDRAQAGLRRRGDGGADPGLDRQGGREAAAAADRHLDQGPDPGSRLPARRMLPPDPGRPDRRPAGARAPRSRSM